MYNDLGSVKRDVREGNLNSINFPEFSFRGKKRLAVDMEETGSEHAYSELMWIAEYERRGLVIALGMLGEELGRDQLWKAIKLFVDLTDLYGQLYVARDIGDR